MTDAQELIAKLRSSNFALPAEIEPDRRLVEQGLDSLDIANLIFEVERLYAVRIEMTEAARIETISQLAELVQARLG